jgi:DNA-binding NtrC family response regulator
VETDAQLSFLRLWGCDEMQGYYFSRPLPAGEAKRWLEDHSRRELRREAPEDRIQTVLLVDDDPGILKLLEQVLRRDGYRVLTAANGRAGLELLTGYAAQVVISELFMPEMNGIEFLKRVRKLYSGAVRIALSGYGELDDLIAMINECAVFKFLAKPIALDALRDALRQAFLWHELHPLQHRLQ